MFPTLKPFVVLGTYLVTYIGGHVVVTKVLEEKAPDIYKPSSQTVVDGEVNKKELIKDVCKVALISGLLSIGLATVASSAANVVGNLFGEEEVETIDIPDEIIE